MLNLLYKYKEISIMTETEKLHILNIYKKIQSGTIEENYMSEAEKRAIVKFAQIQGRYRVDI